MHIKVTQAINKAYYEEYYQAWLMQVSRFKKWQRLFSLLLVILAVLLFIFFPFFWVTGVALLIFSGLLFFDFYWEKRKWMRDRLSSPLLNKKVDFLFTEEGVQSNSILSQTKMEWAYFKDVIDCPKGLILVPENRIHLYLQKDIFTDSDAIHQIIDKIKK